MTAPARYSPRQACRRARAPPSRRRPAGGAGARRTPTTPRARPQPLWLSPTRADHVLDSGEIQHRADRQTDDRAHEQPHRRRGDHATASHAITMHCPDQAHNGRRSQPPPPDRGTAFGRRSSATAPISGRRDFLPLAPLVPGPRSRNAAISLVSRRGRSRSSSGDRACTRSAQGTWPVRERASLNGCSTSARWASTNVGAVIATRCS